jgi:apolipoprotein N-acyltransferase
MTRVDALDYASDFLGRLFSLLEKSAGQLYALSGWRRFGIAFAAGLLSVAAQPPVHFLAILLVTLPSAVWMLDGTGEPSRDNWRAARAAAAIGWWFGFGYFFAGLYWVGEAFLVEAETFGWLLPFAVTGLPAGLALFTAAAFGIARCFWKPGYRRVLVLAMAWACAEWLRGHILTGFPWNLPGQVIVASDALMQSAALFGIYGVTFFILVVFLSLATYDPRRRAPRSDLDAREEGVWRTPALAFAILGLVWLGGALRLASADLTWVDGVTLRIVQPNVAQAEKWKPENRQEILGQFIRVSEAPTDAGGQPTHIIWPESALPFLIHREPLIRSIISRMLAPGGVLLLGAVRGEADPQRPDVELGRFYNSLQVVGPDGEIRSTYDKAHLVPFGEYLPFQSLLEALGLRQLTQLRGGYQSGPGPITLSVPGAPAVSPLICYEIIFSGSVVGRERPGWVVNVTNDAWFGSSAGPYQHLAQARLRAVEQGLPVARAANTGVSAMIDPFGRLMDEIPLNHAGKIDTQLPKALSPTAFARFGDFLLLFLLGGALFLVWRPSR